MIAGMIARKPVDSRGTISFAAEIGKASVGGGVCEHMLSTTIHFCRAACQGLAAGCACCRRRRPEHIKMHKVRIKVAATAGFPY